MPHNQTLSRHIKGQEAWIFFPFIQPLLLKEAHQHNPYPSMQGTDHRTKELKRAAKKPGNQQQYKDPHGEQQVGNSTCHFKSYRSHGLCPKAGKRTWKWPQMYQTQVSPQTQSQLALRQAALMHNSTTCMSLGMSLKRHVLKLSSKLVAPTPVPGTTSGTSAKISLFMVSITLKEQPSQTCLSTSPGRASNGTHRDQRIRAKQDSIQPNLNHQALAKRISTAFY